MKIDVKFYAAYRDLFSAEERDVELEDGASVTRLLESLCDSDEIRRELFDDAGRVRRDVKMMRRGKRTHFVTDPNVILEDGDVLILLPPLFGG
jgi:molybdopterin converting factor small subunit